MELGDRSACRFEEIVIRTMLGRGVEDNANGMAAGNHGVDEALFPECIEISVDLIPEIRR